MKDSFKKLVLIGALIIIILVVVLIMVNTKSGKREEKLSVNTNITRSGNEKNDSKSNNDIDSTENETLNTVNAQEANTVEDNESTENVKLKTKIEELSDGVKYSVSNEEIKPEIVIGDNYFATQVLDMSMNFEQYEGKTIEIEGLYFENMPYTFVGRFSTSVVCPTCPTGYSYFEYEWHGDEELNLTDSDNWIKIIGTLKLGNDGAIDYPYIDVNSIEIMNEKGIETVVN